MKHLLAERAAFGPVTPRKIFVDHADAFRAVRICRGEEPPFAQRNAERREVIAVNAIGIMAVQRLTRRRHIAFRCDRGFAAISAQRDVRDRSGGGDSRLLPDGFQQAIDNTDAVLRKLPRDGALAGENMIGAKAGRDRHHLFQAQPEQGGAREQNKSERDLRDDESVAKPLRGAADRAGARFRLQRVCQMAARG